jgi:hypothetical protein
MGLNKIHTLKKLDEAYKTSRYINLAVLLCFFFLVAFLTIMYRSALVKGIDRIYLVKDNSIERMRDEKEISRQHILIFFKLFFEIDQFNYKKNVNEALFLIGKDGETLNKSLVSNNFYSQMVATNMRCAVDIDSIVFKTSSAPYQVLVYAKWTKRNEYAKKVNNLWCSMELIKTSNSAKNRLGYVIEKFKIFNQDEIKEE